MWKECSQGRWPKLTQRKFCGDNDVLSNEIWEAILYCSDWWDWPAFRMYWVLTFALPVFLLLLFSVVCLLLFCLFVSSCSFFFFSPHSKFFLSPSMSFFLLFAPNSPSHPSELWGEARWEHTAEWWFSCCAGLNHHISDF